MDALTPAEIARFEQRLREAERALRLQLRHEEEASAPVVLDQQAVGRVSRMDAIQRQQMAQASQMQAKALLRLTVAAIGRIAADEYGECLRCGESIGAGRLDAQPHAEHCIECQNELDNHR